MEPLVLWPNTKGLMGITMLVVTLIKALKDNNTIPIETMVVLIIEMVDILVLLEVIIFSLKEVQIGPTRMVILVKNLTLFLSVKSAVKESLLLLFAITKMNNSQMLLLVFLSVKFVAKRATLLSTAFI